MEDRWLLASVKRTCCAVIDHGCLPLMLARDQSRHNMEHALSEYGYAREMEHQQ